MIVTKIDERTPLEIGADREETRSGLALLPVRISWRGPTIGYVRGVYTYKRMYI